MAITVISDARSALAQLLRGELRYATSNLHMKNMAGLAGAMFAPHGCDTGQSWKLPFIHI